MNKKLKIAIIIASVYFILALTAILVSPRIFNTSGDQGSGMINGAPILMQLFLLMVFLASLVGAYLVPMALIMLLPRNAVILLCNPGHGIPSCSTSFAAFVIILFNTIFYFLITYFIMGIFLKGSETTTLKSRTFRYVAIVIIIIFSYLLLKILI